MMNSKFTPAFYDEILAFLVKRLPLGETVYFGDSELGFEAFEEISFDTLVTILKYFERKRLIEIINFGCHAFDYYQLELSLTVEGLSFYSHGGFSAQEELLTKTFEKLQLELDSLKAAVPERTGKITSIMGDIAAVIQAITGIKGMI